MCSHTRAHTHTHTHTHTPQQQQQFTVTVTVNNINKFYNHQRYVYGTVASWAGGGGGTPAAVF